MISVVESASTDGTMVAGDDSGGGGGGKDYKSLCHS